LEPIAVELARAGCRSFFVANLAEARRLRAVAPEAVIYVLNGIAPGSAELFAPIDAKPVIGNIAEFVEWDAFRRASGWQGGAALANSSGIFLGPAAQCDMVRPGAALFGINPTPGAQNLMEPTVTLKGRVVQIRTVER